MLTTGPTAGNPSRYLKYLIKKNHMIVFRNTFVTVIRNVRSDTCDTHLVLPKIIQFKE